MDDIGNDNNAHLSRARPPKPDAHGQAAMLLVESLIHGLIAKSVISVGDALDVIDVAAEVNSEIAVDAGNSSAVGLQSLVLLAAIAQSLKADDRDP